MQLLCPQIILQSVSVDIRGHASWDFLCGLGGSFVYFDLMESIFGALWISRWESDRSLIRGILLPMSPSLVPSMNLQWYIYVLCHGGTDQACPKKLNQSILRRYRPIWCFILWSGLVFVGPILGILEKRNYHKVLV